MTIPMPLTHPAWLGGVLQWHFAAMWLLGVNGVLYLAVNLASGRLQRKFFPLSLTTLRSDVLAVFVAVHLLMVALVLSHINDRTLLF